MKGRKSEREEREREREEREKKERERGNQSCPNYQVFNICIRATFFSPTRRIKSKEGRMEKEEDLNENRIEREREQERKRKREQERIRGENKRERKRKRKREREEEGEESDLRSVLVPNRNRTEELFFGDSHLYPWNQDHHSFVGRTTDSFFPSFFLSISFFPLSLSLSFVFSAPVSLMDFSV